MVYYSYELRWSSSDNTLKEPDASGSFFFCLFTVSPVPARLVSRDATPATITALPTAIQSTVPPDICVTIRAAPVWNIVFAARMPAAFHHSALIRYFIVVVDTSLLLSFVSDAAVQCHDRSDDTIYLLRRLCLGRLDVASRVGIHDHIAGHPCHDRVAAVDDASFHQELAELLGRGLISLNP